MIRMCVACVPCYQRVWACVMCCVSCVCVCWCEFMCATLHLVSLILVVKQHRSFVSSGLAALRSTHRIVYVPCVPNEKEKQKKNKTKSPVKSHTFQTNFFRNSDGEIRICNFRVCLLLLLFFSHFSFFIRLVSKYVIGFSHWQKWVWNYWSNFNWFYIGNSPHAHIPMLAIKKNIKK